MASQAPDPSLFSMLPKARTPWSEFVLSYGVQAIIIAILVWVPVLHPEILESPKRDYHAIELVPTPEPVNRSPQKQLPKHVLVAKLDPIDPPPAAIHLPAPQPRPKMKVEDTPAPEVKIAERKLDLPTASAPVMPRTIKTNVFSTGSSAPQTIDRPAAQVQTGGFGDPNGAPAKLNTGKAPVNIAAAGGFDMPAGPGNGNGTGGANGVRGVVASTGFGNGVAVQDSRPQRAVVKQAGFGDADVAAPPTVQSRPAPVAAKIIPAEILSKPTPIYTDEARAKHIEGEVLLEVVLEASGKVRVLRIVRGLGHGLDDAAVRAAEQIHFKPAMQDGQPSDSTAVLHIIFQLA
jgi:TonB family protein